MRTATNAPIGIDARTDTESEEILRRTGDLILRAADLNARLYSAVNRLNYSSPKKEVDCAAGSPEPSMPPFEAKINKDISVLNHAFASLEEHVERLERFV